MKRRKIVRIFGRIKHIFRENRKLFYVLCCLYIFVNIMVINEIKRKEKTVALGSSLNQNKWRYMIEFNRSNILMGNQNNRNKNLVKLSLRPLVTTKLQILSQSRTEINRNAKSDNHIPEQNPIKFKTQKGNKMEDSIEELLRSSSKNCSIYRHHYYPLCDEKIRYMRAYWKQDECFTKIHQVYGSNCSIFHYLTKIEPFCAGSKDLYQIKAFPKAKFNVEINGLMGLLSDKDYEWMRERIILLWSSWVNGRNEISKIRTQFKKKRVLVFLGSFAHEPRFFKLAGKGGPLGELIQWSDLIAALYVLGYEVIVSKSIYELSNIMKIKSSRCASKEARADLDLIYTDIKGVTNIGKYYGPESLAKYRCMLRVLDSFGTDPPYNYPHYPYKLPLGRSVWGNLNLISTQFLTLYPHNQDNYFLGFVIPPLRVKEEEIVTTNSTRPKALLYAKWSFYTKGYERYLKIISKYFDIYATSVIYEGDLPPFIHNYGPVSSQRVQELLKESKLFIGVGFPFEGPGPLEAIANGAVYLQPKFKKPVNKLNNDKFVDKPTLRKLGSQNPYLHQFVGEPYCYTIDPSDEPLLRKTLLHIKTMQRLPPKIPKEFTSEGYLKRVHAYTEYIDYCNPYLPRWPPVKKLRVVTGLVGQSCKDTCAGKGLVCERTWFDLLNKPSVIEKYSRFNCSRVKEKMALHAPSIDLITKVCYVQEHSQLFSCMYSKERTILRVCPCRDYEKEQTAICRNCL